MQTNKSSVQTVLVVDQDTGYPVPNYFGSANWAYTPPLRKFIDAMPGMGASGANALGQYIPVAVADTRLIRALTTTKSLSLSLKKECTRICLPPRSEATYNYLPRWFPVRILH